MTQAYNALNWPSFYPSIVKYTHSTAVMQRLKVFLEQSLPVIEHYTKLGKARKIDTNRPIDTIYSEVRGYILALGR